MQSWHYQIEIFSDGLKAGLLGTLWMGLFSPHHSLSELLMLSNWKSYRFSRSLSMKQLPKLGFKICGKIKKISLFVLILAFFCVLNIIRIWPAWPLIICFGLLVQPLSHCTKQGENLLRVYWGRSEPAWLRPWGRRARRCRCPPPPWPPWPPSPPPSRARAGRCGAAAACATGGGKLTFTSVTETPKKCRKIVN